MSLPTTVPFELFEALQDQLTQALQMIAAITLTDEEVILCKNPRKSNTENALDEDEDEEEDDCNHLLGWALCRVRFSDSRLIPIIMRI